MTAQNKTESNLQERRKHERYFAAEGAYAALSPKSSKIGQIVNISRGGLAFRYIDNNDNRNENNETHIFLSSKHNHVSKIPIKTVNDYPVHVENSFSKMKVRQRAIRFEEMNLHQLIGLDNYIANNISSFPPV